MDEKPVATLPATPPPAGPMGHSPRPAGIDSQRAGRLPVGQFAGPCFVTHAGSLR